jgi:cytochrome oxidase Cu insertion factor (SCO1/SenC/PrrC family)
LPAYALLRRRREDATDSIAPVIERGEQAPDFELPDQDGREFKLSNFRGTPVVVFFYPRADTNCHSSR